MSMLEDKIEKKIVVKNLTFDLTKKKDTRFKNLALGVGSKGRIEQNNL